MPIRRPSTLLSLAVLLVVPSALRADGAEEAYGTYCGQCHQLDGQGIKGTYPPLDGSAIVNGDAKLLARLVLDGGFPNNAMPAFKVQLTDAQAAQILSFIRTSWSNRAGSVSAEQVAARHEGSEPLPADNGK
jgi:mono/diheme cytochrome c family protein